MQDKIVIPYNDPTPWQNYWYFLVSNFFSGWVVFFQPRVFFLKDEDMIRIRLLTQIGIFFSKTKKGGWVLGSAQNTGG